MERLSMRLMISILPLFLLAGCVSRQTVFVNEQGQRLTCETSGWGFAGSILADKKYDECVTEAKNRGYRLEEQKH
ncbi:MAG TPA: hypothetical protein VNO43_14830 [Candidatus Eisenbacteria bacterium]|nr:hypothetical protein [Candidatus Eisenbacteria bacterium]